MSCFALVLVLIDAVEDLSLIHIFSITRDKASADAVCSVEGTPSGTGEGYEARLKRDGEGRGILYLKAAAPQGLFLSLIHI